MAKKGVCNVQCFKFYMKRSPAKNGLHVFRQYLIQRNDVAPLKTLKMKKRDVIKQVRQNDVRIIRILISHEINH